MPRFVLISGRVGSGKSELARGLANRYGARHIKTRIFVGRALPFDVPQTRIALQDEGDRLDSRTSGRWLADALAGVVGPGPEDDLVVVDSVRRAEQVEAIRRAFGPHVVHVHVTAPPEVLAARFRRRRSRPGEAASFAAASANATEAQVDELGPLADALIDTSRSTTEDVLVRAAARLGLAARSGPRLVDVLVGGQYGSEGKGHIASYMAPEYQLLIRVGGPNAGHKVMLGSGPYTHHLLPSGTRLSEARLLLAAGATIDLDGLLTEIAECGVDQSRLAIDPQVMVITAADRLAEKRLVDKIGSTGQGVGAATARRIMDGRAEGRSVLAEAVPELRPFIRPAGPVLESAYAAGLRIMVEGTQGVGLSLYHGWYPHVTSRDPSTSGALSEVGIPPGRVGRVIMVVRTYPIRVQSPIGETSGRMSREISWAEVSRRSGLPVAALRRAERTSTTNRRRRVAEFDWDLLRHAAALNGPTDIALSFVDYLDAANEKARRFDQLTDRTIRFIEEVESVAGAPVSLISTRFHPRGIIDRRAW